MTAPRVDLDAAFVLTTTLPQRWEKYTKRGPGCWEWQGRLRDDGYGFLKAGTGLPNMMAHRISWLLHRGDVPDGLFVCHHCDNKRCVRPDHLYVATGAQNTYDARDRGLMNRGSARWNARWTEDQVARIKAEHASGLGYKRLGRRHGTSPKTIQSLVKGWKHVQAA